MDHRRTLAALLIGFAAMAAAPAGDVPLREARWIAADQRVAALIRPLAACQRPAADTATQRLVDLGELAFRTPLLLGGQAARAGLSCNSCHVNGRDNPGFSFPGVSGAPGTADVTTSILSSHRGDGQFNPKRIPDLALDPPIVAVDADDRALKRFIRGLIVEEFDGPEPSPDTLVGLAEFVRHQGTTDCARRAPVLATSSDETLLIRKALAIAASDEHRTSLGLMAARAALGRLHERYVGLAREQAAIVGFDEKLAARQRGTSSEVDLEKALNQLSAMLARAETRSLYNSRRLAKALK